MERNFNRCNFKIGLPEISDTPEEIVLSFWIQGKSGTAGTIKILSGQITDTSGHTRRAGSFEIQPDKVTISELEKNLIQIKFSKKGIQLTIGGVYFNIVLLYVEEGQQTHVFYKVRPDRNSTLLGVETLPYEPEKELVKEPDFEQPLPLPSVDTEGQVVPFANMDQGIIWDRTDPETGEREPSFCIRQPKYIRLQETAPERIHLMDFADDERYAEKTLADLLAELNAVPKAKQKINELQEETVSILRKNAALRGLCRQFENDAAEQRKENHDLRDQIRRLSEDVDLAEQKQDIENRKRDTVIQNLKKEKSDLKQEIGQWKRKVTRLEKEKQKLEEKLKLSSWIPREIDMEKHLNSIIEFMDGTARQYGITLNNNHVVVAMRDNKYNVNVRGEIGFTDGATMLKRSVYVKASLYSVKGHIELEGRSSILKDGFAGYDTFDIGWIGGGKESWLALTKIRLFVVAI